MAIEEGVLGIGIQSYGHIKGELHVLSKINQNVDYNQYDHIVEGGIEIKSDVLEVLDCPNSNIELQVKINPGRYRVRIYSSNILKINLIQENTGLFDKIDISDSLYKLPNTDSLLLIKKNVGSTMLKADFGCNNNMILNETKT